MKNKILTDNILTRDLCSLAERLSHLNLIINSHYQNKFSTNSK